MPGDTSRMSETEWSKNGGENPSAPLASLTYQKGVWVTKNQGARIEKYQKWTEDQTKSQVEKLEKEQNEKLVKLNSQCLQVRTELRGLKYERHRLSRCESSSDCTDGAESAGSTAPSVTNKGMPKSFSSNSLISLSSGYSSLSSTTSMKRRNNGLDMDRGGEGLSARGVGPGLKVLDPAVLAVRLKNLRSARALSKLKHNMDVSV